jgi:hypothetical protein
MKEVLPDDDGTCTDVVNGWERKRRKKESAREPGKRKK